jgi:3',5'-cyclic-AMP phosphodiesterase
MLLAQLSDPHVGALDSAMEVHFHTADNLARSLQWLHRRDPRPDAIAITGDLVDTGTVAEYQRLAEILAAVAVPVFLIPGNHDDRDHLRQVFTDHDYLPSSGFLCYQVELDSVLLVGLDTNIPGRPSGRLCRERLAWLDRCLSASADRPTIIMQHHPPFATGIRAMDRMGLEGQDELAQVLRRHDQVEAVICGHLHRAIAQRFAGTVALTSPSTTRQLDLDLRNPGELAIIAEPIACYLHLWRPETGLVSHLAYIDHEGELARTRMVVG